MKHFLIAVLLAAPAQAQIAAFNTFPGGTAYQIQVSSGGRFAGVQGSTVTGQNVALSGALSVLKSSVNASAFFGNGAGLTGVTSAPSGTAGGNLGGTYPNPSIASLPAISGANLTALTGANVTGTVPAATALAANGANCSAASFPLGVDASGAAESCTALSASNAGTATALAANGGNCAADSYPLGVDASGAVESCGTAISGNAGTATALAANPTNCSAGNYPLGVDASGNVESCTAVSAGGDVTNTGTNILYSTNALTGATTFYGAISVTSFTYQSVATNGYVLVGPILYQWGQYTGGANSPAITFPVAFTTLYGVTGQVALGSAINGSMLEVVSPTASGFTGNQRRHDAAVLTDNFYWWAWGRR